MVEMGAGESQNPLVCNIFGPEWGKCTGAEIMMNQNNEQKK